MKHILIFATTLLCGQAFAGFMVDPFVGYDMGAMKATTTAGANADTKSSGLSYGARLGYRLPDGISFAGEYMGGSGKNKDDSGSATPAADQDYSKSVASVILGFDRGMYRVWAGYGVSDQFTSKGTGANSDTIYKGTNYKIGFGVMPIRHLSVNFQYIVPTYTKIASGSAADVDVSTVYSKLNASVMSISLSSPFDFGGK